MRDWVPGNEHKLIAMCRKWEGVLGSEERRTEYKWDAGLCLEAHGKIVVYLDASDAYTESDSTINRMARNRAKVDVITAMRTFATTSVRNNPFMSVAAREYLGVRTPDTTPTVHARPTSMPHIVVVPTGVPLQHHVRALTPGNKGKGKPTGVHGVRFVWQVGGERPKSGSDILRGQFSRKPEIVVINNETDRGQPVYYSACYENTKGETGPWAFVTEAYIG
jgi:hypothetical protein